MSKIEFERAGSLVDELYQRESLLRARGLSSFTPALRFVEDFCDTPEDLEECRSFEILFRKAWISRSKAVSDELGWYYEEADRIFKETDDTCDRGPTKFHRKYRKEKSIARVNIDTNIKKYRLECESYRKLETRMFSSGKFEEGQDFDIKNRKKIYKSVMDDRGSELNICRDKDLNTYNKPVYSRQLAGDWRLLFRLENKPLGLRVADTITYSDTGMSWRTGPLLTNWLEVAQVRPGRKDCETELAFSIESFLPIREYPLGIENYSKFYTAAELEAICRIHLVLYALIQEELESAFIEDLKAAGAA